MVPFLLLFLLLYVDLNVEAMEEKDDKVRSVPSQYIDNNDEFKRDFPDFEDYKDAYELFHDFGLDAVYDFKLDDQSIEEEKQRKVNEFITHGANSVDVKEAVHKDMNYFLTLLPYMYRNYLFDNLILLIQGTYQVLAHKSENSDNVNRCKQWKRDAHITIEKIRADRDAQKRLNLENKVLEILKANRDGLGTMIRTKESSALYLHLTGLCTSFDIARHSFQDERISLHAHEIFAHVCFTYSYWSWLHNENERALEFGEKAQDVTEHWVERISSFQNPYIYWVDMLHGKKRDEQYTAQGTKIFKKRKLPHAKTVFQKKQHLENKHEED